MSESATQVRERPILFSGPMVRALLDGRKTQTRRVVKPQPEFFQSGDNWLTWRQGTRVGGGRNESAWASHALDRCPYGAPGDRLWVRESFVDMRPKLDVLYAADCPPGTPAGVRGGWRPSIFMPRAFSRLTLEITDVRVQRVQEISEDDARAEGVEREAWPEDVTDEDSTLNAECGYFPPRSHAAAFARLWDSLNAARGYGWDVNPWVWCVTFRRVEAPADA